MKTVTEHLRTGLFDRLGIDETEKRWSDEHKMRAEINGKNEVLEEIVKLAKNRLIMGAIRYGKSTTVSWDVLQSKFRTKLAVYEKTGNAEMLVDLVNYCAIEFKHRTHPKSHFRALDDEAHG